MLENYMIFTDFGESIGCSLTAEGAAIFLEWLEEDLTRLNEFMPDSEPEDVRYLYIGDAV